MRHFIETKHKAKAEAKKHKKRGNEKNTTKLLN